MAWGDENPTGAGAGSTLNTLQLYIKALNGEINLDQDSLATLEDILANAYEGNPDAFDAMASKLTPEEKKALGMAGAEEGGAGGDDPRAQALRDLASLLGVGSEETPGDTKSDIARDRTQTGTENTLRDTLNRETTNSRETNNRASTTVQNETGNFTNYNNETGNTVQNVQQNTRRYIEVPTAEEFMNDFSVGFATHLRRLGESGTVNRMALNWAAENPQIFLNSYLGKLGDMAANGQNIYQLAGLSGKEQFLGSREGESSSSTTQQQGQTVEQNRQVGSQTNAGATTETAGGSRATDSRQLTDQTMQQTEASKAVSDEIANILKGIGATGPGVDGKGVSQQQIEHMVDNLLSTMGSNLSAEERNLVRNNFSSTNRESFSNTKNTDVMNTNINNMNVRNTRNVKEREDLYARSRITPVFNLSPLDFLDNQWSGGDLTLQYEAFRRTGTGSPSGGPVSTRLVQ